MAARLQLDPSAVTHFLALAYEPPTLLLELYHSRRCRAPHLLYALRRLIDQHGPALEDALADGQVVDRQRVDALTAQLSGDDKAALPPYADRCRKWQCWRHRIGDKHGVACTRALEAWNL